MMTRHRRIWRTAATLAAVAMMGLGTAGSARAAGPGWIPMGSGLDAGAFGTGSVYATLPVGGLTYVGGILTSADGVTVNHVAAWDGTTYRALGDPATDGPTDFVWSLATDGALIYAGGPFGVMAWDPAGETWTDLGAPADLAAYTLRWYDDGTDQYLVAGGENANDSQLAELWAYDPTPGTWRSIATVACADVSPCGVYALAQYGDQLAVGGQYETIASTPYSSLALWDGATDTWSSMAGTSSSGVTWGLRTGYVGAFAVDGSVLYVGGAFDDAGGTAAGNLVTWQPGQFNDVGGASGLFNPDDHTIDAIFLTGGGLMIGGLFGVAGVGTNVAAYLTGSDQWFPISGGVDDGVYTISFNQSLGQMYFGGEFGTAYLDDGTTPVADTNGIVAYGETGSPARITGVSVTGTARVGSTLTAHVATTGDPAPTVSLQWLRCDAPVVLTAPVVRSVTERAFLPNGCVAISGATGTTYVLTTADRGKYVGVLANAGNDLGSALDLSVRPTAVVAAPATTLPATGTSVPAWPAPVLVLGGLGLMAVARRRPA